jgi:hypothetical protein
MLYFVQWGLTSESPSACSFIRQAILLGQADSIAGCHVLNCSFDIMSIPMTLEQ